MTETIVQTKSGFSNLLLGYYLRHVKCISDDDIKKGLWDTFTNRENEPAPGTNELNQWMSMVLMAIVNMCGIVPIAYLQGGVMTDVSTTNFLLGAACYALINATQLSSWSKCGWAPGEGFLSDVPKMSYIYMFVRSSLAFFVPYVAVVLLTGRQESLVLVYLVVHCSMIVLFNPLVEYRTFVRVFRFTTRN